MSQTGPFFWKISLVNATYFDITPLAGLDDKEIVLNSAQDAGVQDENCTVPIHGISTPKLDWHLGSGPRYQIL